MEEQEKNYFGYVTTEKEEPRIYSHYSMPETETRTKNQDYLFAKDDYSVNQNFEEQSGYDIRRTQIFSRNPETLRPIEMPLVDRKIRSEQNVVHIGMRLKIILSAFVIIMASLIFATAWNFSMVSKMKAEPEVSEKTISELQVVVQNLTSELESLTDEETIRELANEKGYVPANENNKITLTLDEMYEEQIIPEVPSNWFNDVCNFVSSIFN